MRSLTQTPNLSQPAPSPKMRISAPVPRNLQSGEFPQKFADPSQRLRVLTALLKLVPPKCVCLGVC